MFAKKSDIKSLGRLKKRSDFLYLQQKGKKWVAKGLVVEVRENEGLGLRYGLTVSKRVSKLAVIRNRYKRRLKAVACDVLPLYANQNLDIVLIGRFADTEREYEDLKNDLIWCLRKLGHEKSTEKNPD